MIECNVCHQETGDNLRINKDGVAVQVCFDCAWNDLQKGKVEKVIYGVQNHAR